MTILRIVLGFLGASSALLSPSFASEPDYVLVQKYEYSNEDIDGGGSGSGSGNTVLAERIVEKREGGIVVEYSIPGDQETIRGNAMWMYPARVFVATDGTKTLLNADELEGRVEDWLKKAGWTREVCGRWIFTWNAFQILCDPQKVLEQIEGQDMRPGVLVAGETFALEEYGTQAILRVQRLDGTGELLCARATVDPAYARRSMAEMSVVLAQFEGEELSLEEALETYAAITTKGHVTLTFTLDENGLVAERKRVYDMVVSGGADGSERRKGSSTTVRMIYEDWLKR